MINKDNLENSNNSSDLDLKNAASTDTYVENNAASTDTYVENEDDYLVDADEEDDWEEDESEEDESEEDESEEDDWEDADAQDTIHVVKQGIIACVLKKTGVYESPIMIDAISAFPSKKTDIVANVAQTLFERVVHSGNLITTPQA